MRWWQLESSVSRLPQLLPASPDCIADEHNKLLGVARYLAGCRPGQTTALELHGHLSLCFVLGCSDGEEAR